jgi:hypothetical protein
MQPYFLNQKRLVKVLRCREALSDRRATIRGSFHPSMSYAQYTPGGPPTSTTYPYGTCPPRLGAYGHPQIPGAYPYQYQPTTYQTGVTSSFRRVPCVGLTFRHSMLDLDGACASLDLILSATHPRGLGSRQGDRWTSLRWDASFLSCRISCATPVLYLCLGNCASSAQLHSSCPKNIEN